MSYVKQTWATGDVITASKLNHIETGIEELNNSGETSSDLTTDVKQALLQIAQKVAYIDTNGQSYYNDLYNALYHIVSVELDTTSIRTTNIGGTTQLTATTVPANSPVTWSSSNTSVATVSNSGLVTSVGYGSAVITVASENDSATCNISVIEATLTSISAELDAGNHIFYVDDNVNDVKEYLTVTAHYSDNSTSVISSANYTLTGSLSVNGANTITITYENQTTTVSVTAILEIRSISAVYTQSGTVYDNDTINSLKANLVVTATWSNSSTTTVASADYTLSGILEATTSTITVTYLGVTTTFTVAVTETPGEIVVIPTARITAPANNILAIESYSGRSLVIFNKGSIPIGTINGVDYYPIPIEGFTSVTISTDAGNIDFGVMVAQYDVQNEVFMKVYDPGWRTNGTTVDISAYSNGGYYLGVNLKNGAQNSSTTTVTLA